MQRKQLAKRRVRAPRRTIERFRVICIRNTDYCVCDDKVPVAIYSDKAAAEAHCLRLRNQQTAG
jgi:hypothetical protein